MIVSKTALLPLLALSIFLFACEDKKPIVEKNYRPVQYIKVEPKGGIRKETFSGLIEADLDAELSFRVSGTVSALIVKVGDLVRTNQLLAEIDATDYRVSVQQTQANLQQAIANQRNQKANYERVIELYENNNSSKSDLDSARAGADSAKAAALVARKQVESAQLQLSYTQIKSPQQCSVADVLVDANEAVKAGEPVIRVNCGACNKVKVSVPDRLINDIASGDKVIVSISAFPGKLFSAKVTEVSVAAASGGTFPVEALLEGECPNLRAGMSANLQFDFSDASETYGKKRLLIPYLSVGEDGEGNFVYVLKQVEGEIYRAEKRRVVFTTGSNNGAEIISGVSVGELVATAGVRRLIDGMEVKLLNKPILGNN